MSLTGPIHPLRQGLLVVGCPVGRIISGFQLREPLHAGGMDLSDPVLEVRAFDIFLDFAILEGSFQRGELPFLENFGELLEVAPGKDAMPFGAGLILALSFFQLSWVAR